MAEGLAEMGANLVLCARKKERCEQAAEELKQLGVKTLALACDVKDLDQIRDVVQQAASEFGRIDVLINNADAAELGSSLDRKSTRLNSSHGYISYAVFCLKKKIKPRHSHARAAAEPHPSTTRQLG